jgi:tetratricopeptide (TPR) repeat protein
VSLGEEVEKLLESKSFSEAEKLLRKQLYPAKEIDEENYHQWLLLVQIQTKYSKEKLIESYKKLIQNLESSSLKNKSDEIVQHYEIYSGLTKPNIQQWMIYLNAVWDCGQLEKYHHCSEDLLNFLLASKCYPGLFLVVPELIKNKKNWLKPKIYLLIAYVNLNNSLKAIETANDIINDINTKWRVLDHKKLTLEEYYLKIYSILSMIEYKDHVIETYMLKFAGTIYSKFQNSEYMLHIKDIIKLLILAGDELDTLLISISNIINEDLKLELVQRAKVHQDFDIKMIRDSHRQVINLFSPNLKVTYASSKEEALPSMNDGVLKTAPTQQSYEDISQILKLYGVDNLKQDSVTEKELVEQIRIGEFKGYEFKKDLVIALHNLGFSKAAIAMLDNHPDDSDKLYLICEILYSTKRYVDVIAEINLGVSRGVFEKDIPVEFLYLEAESYLKQGNKQKAITIYQKIMQVDPDFRQVKERINNA